MSLVRVIGRGHSGTRAMSHTLYGSGVYMGETLNAPGDLVERVVSDEWLAVSFCSSLPTHYFF